MLEFTPSTPTRRCYKCREEKPLSDFYRDTHSPSGLQGRCKACCKADASTEEARRKMREHMRARRVQNTERERAIQAVYRERHRETVNARARERWGAEQEAEKQMARRAVFLALSSGRLAKPSACQQCGTERPSREITAHHDDYRRPLEVVWLCTFCHGAKRRKE
jgi:hypothetical protein